MDTTKKLHIGMMATAAAVALLTGCQRREEADTTTVTPPPASSTAPAPSTSPGTSGYTGPATGESSSSSSSMSTSPGTGSSGAPGDSTSSSPSSSSDTSSSAPGTSGYVGGSSPGSASGSSGAEATISDQDRMRSGSGTSGSDSGTSGGGTSGTGSGTSGGSGPSSSLDRPFRDVAVATPGAARGPAAWREVLGVQVLRVADVDKAMSDKDKAGGKLSKKDESFIKKAAAGGMFEIEAARLAAEKATDPQLKTFAEKLREQHQQANDELKQIASARGVTMPTQMPSKEKAMLDKLNKASGDKFDKEFISMVGLRDHKQDIRDFENARNETSDPELKAWIEKTLPTLRTHLAEAQQMSGHEGMKMQGYTGQEQEKQQGYTGQERQEGSTGRAQEAQQLDEQRKSGIGESGVGGSAN